MRAPVRVDTFLHQLRGVFPDRVVAGHEHHASLLQGRDGVAGGAEHTIWIFMHRDIVGYILYVDERVGLEVVARHRGELILVPHRLVVERQVRRTVRGRTPEPEFQDRSSLEK